MLRNNEQQIEDELVLKERKIYVLRNKDLRLEIIQLHHDMLITEHERQQKTVELITRNYWWPEVIKEVKLYMKRCNQVSEDKKQSRDTSGKIETKCNTRETIVTYISKLCITNFIQLVSLQLVD